MSTAGRDYANRLDDWIYNKAGGRTIYSTVSGQLGGGRLVDAVCVLKRECVLIDFKMSATDEIANTRALTLLKLSLV